MLARRTDPSIPVWSRDQLDSPYPPEVETSYFDESLNAWVLSRHADIQVVFRSSSFVPGKPESGDGEDSPKETARLQLRTHSIDWQGGPVFRSPRSLWIYLRENRK
jgi:hypothetical protein